MQCLAFSPDGNRVVAGNDEGRLWVVEARTGKTVLECRDVLTAPTAVAWSPDGKHLAMGGWVGLITVRDAQTGAVQTRWRAHRENVTSIVFSADINTSPPVVAMTPPRCGASKAASHCSR